MSAKTSADVLIGGKIYTLSGYESETYLQKVAAYINNKINEFEEMEQFRRFPVEMKSTLIELNIADDYFKAKDQAEKLEQDIDVRNKEIYDLKHELISAQIKLENNETSIIQLERENRGLLLHKAKLESSLENALLGEVKKPKNETLKKDGNVIQMDFMTSESAPTKSYLEKENNNYSNYENSDNDSDYENSHHSSDYENSDYKNSDSSSDYENSDHDSDYGNSDSSSDYENSNHDSDYKNSDHSSDYENSDHSSDYENSVNDSDYENSVNDSDYENSDHSSDYENSANDSDDKNSDNGSDDSDNSADDNKLHKDEYGNSSNSYSSNHKDNRNNSNSRSKKNRHKR